MHDRNGHDTTNRDRAPRLVHRDVLVAILLTAAAAGFIARALTERQVAVKTITPVAVTEPR